MSSGPASPALHCDWEIECWKFSAKQAINPGLLDQPHHWLLLCAGSGNLKLPSIKASFAFTGLLLGVFEAFSVV